MLEIFPLSNKKPNTIENLKQYLLGIATEGEWHYAEDDITDKGLRFLTAEITREKLFESLNQELPYSLNVVTDEISEVKEGVREVLQTIFVQREGQKIIIIGKKGGNLKEISQLAAKDMETLLECRVKLSLFVKISKDWAEHWRE